jgi:hypothetical protein
LRNHSNNKTIAQNIRHEKKKKEKESQSKTKTQTLHNQKGNEEEENSSRHFNNFNTFVNLEMKSETFIFLYY